MRSRGVANKEKLSICVPGHLKAFLVYGMENIHKRPLYFTDSGNLSQGNYFRSRLPLYTKNRDKKKSALKNNPSSLSHETYSANRKREIHILKAICFVAAGERLRSLYIYYFFYCTFDWKLEICTHPLFYSNIVLFIFTFFLKLLNETKTEINFNYYYYCFATTNQM